MRESSIPPVAAPVPASEGPEVLARRARDIEEKIQTLRQVQSSGRKRAAVTVLGMAGLVLAFVGGSYLKVQSNFSEPAMRAAMAQHLPEFKDALQRELVLAGEELLPAYKAEALTAMERTGPKVAAAFAQRIEALPGEIGPVAMRRTDEAVARVFARLAPEIERAIGKLPDEREKVLIEELVDKTVAHVQAQTDAIAGDKVRRIRAALEKLDIPEPVGHADLGGQQRRFVHLLLMLADQELMTAWGEDLSPKATAAAVPAK